MVMVTKTKTMNGSDSNVVRRTATSVDGGTRVTSTPPASRCESGKIKAFDIAPSLREVTIREWDHNDGEGVVANFMGEEVV
jgi:hypothetical protein